MQDCSISKALFRMVKMHDENNNCSDYKYVL